MEAPQEQIRCTRCKVIRNADEFRFVRAGVRYKTCTDCRATDKLAADRRKAELTVVEMHHCDYHNTDCAFSVYEGRRYTRCDTRRTARYCEHNIQKTQCLTCGGSSICIHGCRRATCVTCVGSAICSHGCRRAKCVECRGSEICDHDLQKYQCKLCSNPMEVTIKKMISGSRSSDRKFGLYTREVLDDYITKEHIENLIDLYDNSCVYCYEEMNPNIRNPLLVTIERIDNSIGHTKANTTICCFNCNSTRVGSTPAGVAAREAFNASIAWQAQCRRERYAREAAAEAAAAAVVSHACETDESKEEEDLQEEKTN